MSNSLIKKQFNTQAENFSNWSITQNMDYLQLYADFCKISSEDTVLDVACGTGELSHYFSKQSKHVHAVDISENEIQIARKNATENELNNITFYNSDVENIPLDNNSCNIIICKSAFHHFTNPDKVFKEMTRCCKKDGRISIQDIISFNNNPVNSLYEEFEKKVDVCHNKTMSKDELESLYKTNGFKIENSAQIEVELNLNDYLNHAVQSQKNKDEIYELITNSELKSYFFRKNEEIYFKRNVVALLGSFQK